MTPGRTDIAGPTQRMRHGRQSGLLYAGPLRSNNRTERTQALQKADETSMRRDLSLV